MASDSQEAKDNGKKTRFGVKAWFVLIAMISMAGLTGYYWNEARQANLQTPQATLERNTKETEKVLTELKRVLLIEDKGNPTVARIDNPEKLQSDNPEFYKNAQKDDYIIVYKQRAIIFRASEQGGKIINIAPIINTGGIQGDKKPAAGDQQSNQEEQQPAGN